jgi:hypothetical protein
MCSIKSLHSYLVLLYVVLYDDQLDSRANPFQEGEDDEDIPTINTSSTINGPITRSRAKQIHDQVNANLSLPYNLDLDEMAMLSSTLLLVEFRTSLKEAHNNEEQSFNNKFSSYQQQVFNKSAALNTASDLS